jgi:thioredoxin-like negative regulator of GroEL
METINNPEQFSQFIENKPAPVVCFHSRLSAYSRRTVATLLEIEPQFPSAAFGLADVDRHNFAELVRHYSIVALPTVILFRGGGNIVMFLGEHSAKSWTKLFEIWLLAGRPATRENDL